MLMVGLYGKGSSSNAGNNGKGCTKEEYQTHFALWYMLSAPLIVNSDLQGMPGDMLELLTNKKLIAIDQDKLGKQAVTIYKNNGIQVLTKELANGDVAICIFNRNNNPVSGTLSLQRDLDTWKPFSSARAIFQDKIIKKPATFNYNLGVHVSEVFRLTP
jgi:alpha-galactosidase